MFDPTAAITWFLGGVAGTLIINVAVWAWFIRPYRDKLDKIDVLGEEIDALNTWRREVRAAATGMANGVNFRHKTGEDD